MSWAHRCQATNIDPLVAGVFIVRVTVNDEMPGWFYYLRKRGVRSGRVWTSDLKDLAASGQLEPTDYVWKEGLRNWIEARKVKGLFPLRVRLGQILAPRQATGSALPPPSSKNQPTLPESQRAGWFYLVNDVQAGPVSTAKLRELAANGHLKPSDLIWREGIKDWIEARMVKDLFPAATTSALSPQLGPAKPQSTVKKRALPPTGQPVAHPSASRSASVVTTVGKTAVTTPAVTTAPIPPSPQTLEIRLRELFDKHGSALCGDLRRCESIIRDICGDKRTDANLLILALKQQVPADLLAIPKGSPPTPTLVRLQTRLQDNFGTAEAPARWTVRCWAMALRVVTDAVDSTSPSPAESTAHDPAVTYSEILLDPQRHVGRSVRIKGKYQYVFPDDCRFLIEDRDGHKVNVYYQNLPRDQKALVLNERLASDKPTLVEGRVEQTGDSEFAILATKVYIKRRRPKGQNHAVDAEMPDWDGCGPCSRCHTVINMKFENAVCPICGNRMSVQEAFRICGKFDGELPSNVYSERDLR
jgi:hypothetical protein